jgi:single-stranded DNA-binding protein
VERARQSTQPVKASRVIVVGRSETDAWPDPETGEKRTTIRVIVDRHGAIGRTLNTAWTEPANRGRPSR